MATYATIGNGLDRAAGQRYAIAALALACLLSLAVARHAHSQSSADGPPAPLCRQRIQLAAYGRAWQLPADINRSLDRPNPAITRVVVGIHGIDRIANAPFGALIDAERSIGCPVESKLTTLIVAPQFPTETERERYHLTPDIPCWRGTKWIQGDESTPCGGRPGISSFSLMDRLLERLASPACCPNLRTIVIAGHSGGGQFVQRYAAGTAIEEQLASRGITVSYVVANPSSYLYLTPDRPVAGSSDLFTPPSPAVRRKVPYYNNYKYGLDRLNNYMRKRGADRIRADYVRNHITYLLGECDNDPRHPQLDRGKAALVQGTNRLARGTAFFQCLRRTYGEHIARTQSLAIVPAAGHNIRQMFTSDAGIGAIFSRPNVSSTAPR